MENFTSNEQNTHTVKENHVDINAILIEMRKELENLKRRNEEEIQNLKQENKKLKKNMSEREHSTIPFQEEIDESYKNCGSQRIS